ncbi:Inositol monophosphatase 3-like protein [Dinothrombium tinctorium]|uniref:inositol-phosphate phosphatase n=1 Tax=Dinothrombium tinctorium TaxID=1965070 RepID=A0A3S3PFI8_9ACAR|nr:Inositol monophosphatase 3-like protein [Dinothrombium tinctorium]RWS15952.1 Inositol monophosphatase 3-like protein [Dinothrombium tinctorium]
MWPYMIRLNPIGISIACFAFVCIYFLYSSSKLSTDDLYANSFAKRFKLKSPNSDIFANQHFSPIVTINLKTLLAAVIKAAEIGGNQVRSVYDSHNLQAKNKGETKEGVKLPVTFADIRSHRAMVNSLSLNFPGLRIISEENESTNEETENPGESLTLKANKLLLENEFRQLSDRERPLSDLVVWIDPLDATKEFTENLLQYVTTMVCVSYKGKPIIGVIHKLFDSNQNPRSETYWAWAGNGISSSLQELLNNRNKSIVSNQTRVIISRSHGGEVKKVANTAFGKHTQFITAAGSGYKTIELIKGNADIYVHITAIKKWDICAPNALMNAIKGGRMSTLLNEDISYGFEESVLANDGLLATLFANEEKHKLSAQNLKAALNSIRD